MHGNRKRKAVFMDRDGTLIVDRGYLSDPGLVDFFPGVIEALALLRDAGFLLFIVTNQSGVGRGMFTMDEVNSINARMTETLTAENIPIENFYVAPEAPGSPSHGRKPSPNFLLDAAREFKIDLESSYMIGDKISDIECGINSGVAHSYLVETGHGIREHSKLNKERDTRTTVVKTFIEVATIIVRSC